MDDSKIFDKKLSVNIKKLTDIDIHKRSQILGLQQRGEKFIFEFLNRHILYSPLGFEDKDRSEVTDAIKTVLTSYIIGCPDAVVDSSNRLVSFREFNKSGPLFSRFTANTSKIIETTFSGHLEKLTSQCLELGGTLVRIAGYDLSVRFRALPRIPVIFHFNDAEENMPATAVFLFHDNADIWLDLESLTLISTYLTGQLINPNVAYPEGQT